MASLPIQFKEIAQLSNLSVPIPQDSIGFATLTMESEKYICIRDITQAEKYVLIVNLDDTQRIIREKITADSAIMAPTKTLLALKALGSKDKKQALQIFDIAGRNRLNECVMNEPVDFWKWIDDDTLALVTPTAVYHWPINGKPNKAFGRLDNMTGGGIQIINYRVSKDGNWCVLIGIAKKNERIVGSMQLHSMERSLSQFIEGHAATFLQYKFAGEMKTLFCFASRTANQAKLLVADVSPESKFERKQTDIYFPPEATQDFPVAMQASEKYCVVYLITKFGYIHIFHVGTGKLIYMNRISAEPIFVTAPYVAEGGIIGVNRRGQVLSVSIDPNNVIQYLFNELHDPDLAIKLASDAGIEAGSDLFLQQFNQFFSQQKFREAAEIAALSPNGMLRTNQTIQKFQSLPAIGGHPPLLIYFTVLLEKGKLNKIESIELVRPVLQQGKKELLETWLKEDKVECSEELGDLVRPFDSMLALSVYYRAGAKEKVISCLAQNGQLDKVHDYAQRLPGGYTPDYSKILSDLVMNNNRKGALDLALSVYKDQNSQTNRNFVEEIGKVVELFMSRNMLQETTSLLYDVLKNDRPEEGPLQTKLLEVNLVQAPQVAHALLGNNMYHHYNRTYVATLCEKAGLYQRALEHYTDLMDRKRVILNGATTIPQEVLVSWFGLIEPKDALELLKELMRNRANVTLAVNIAKSNSDKIGAENLIALFESNQSYEGLYYYLGNIVDYSQDPDVHYKFIEAATKMNQLKDVERVLRESKIYDPEKVKEFLKTARLQDQLPLIIVCDIWGFVEDLTHYLYKNSMSQYIEAYVQTINPINTPLVVGALLDDDCNEDYIRKLVMSVGHLCPVDELVAQVEKRNRLRLLKPFLEARIAQGNQEPATHNAIAKIYIEEGNEATEKFLSTNSFYDSRVIGKYCENRDPYLAYLSYKRGLCDKELINVTNKHSLFKNQARYLVERQNPDLWKLVLEDTNEFRQQVLDKVIETALPESKVPEEIISTVKALMNANMPKVLIELLEKIILDGSSEFSNYKDLQNLLILTAIKADTGRVMDYINKLQNYDAQEIADIAEKHGLFEESFQIYKKFHLNLEAMNILITKIEDVERAQDYAESVKDPKVWSALGAGQLNSGKVKDAIESYMKSSDATNYAKVIAAAERENIWEDLVKYLMMCRKVIKESQIESELAYSLAKIGKLAELEEFITGPNIALIQVIADRCFEEGMFEAAKLLYSNISNYSRLASTLVKLEQYSQAVEAARKANAIKTWKEVNRALLDVKEFQKAQICALHIVIQGEELDNLVKEYEIRGYFDEIITALETSITVQDQKSSFNGIFTELAILYSKYKPEKLDGHIKSWPSRVNTIPKVIRVCTANQQWKEVAYLYEIYGETENAVNTMISHPVESWDHRKLKEMLSPKDKNFGATNDVIYRTIKFYLLEHPLQVNDLLSSVGSKIDQEKLVRIAEGMKLLPLVKTYLESVQSVNLKGVNDALNQLYIEEEDWTSLRNSIQNNSNFDVVALAKQLKSTSNKESLLEPRRIAAQLYQRLGRFDESLQLSKDDFNYKEAMRTAAASNDPEIVEQLLRFFIEQKLYECFSAALYTCYDLVKPDVAMELAWKAGVTNLAMPYLIQVMREFNTRTTTLAAGGPGGQPKKNAIPSRLTGDVSMDGGSPVVYSPNVVDPNFYNPAVLGGPVGYGPGVVGPSGVVLAHAPMGTGMYAMGPPVSGGVFVGGTPPLGVTYTGGGGPSSGPPHGAFGL